MTIRKGDLVRVVDPHFYVRCGYPLSFEEVKDWVAKEKRGEIERFVWDTLGVKPPLQLLSPDGHLRGRVFWPIVKALAYEELRRRKFGGPERTIHTRHVPKAKGQLLRVRRTFVRKTGTYYPPTSGYYGPEYEYDWEPGGLANERTHVILVCERADSTPIRRSLLRIMGPEEEPGSGIRIERDRVVKVKQEEEDDQAD